MLTLFYPPHAALVEYVESICIISHDFSVSDEISPFYTYMPTYTRFLCFHLADRIKVKKKEGEFELKERSLIIGPQITPVTLDLGKKHSLLVVILKPGALYRILGIPQQEIVECDFDANLILGKEVSEILEQLINAENGELQNKIIQKYLLGKLQKLKALQPIDLAMQQLVMAKGKLGMDYLAKKSCISLRQFERQSLNRIGVSPKYFARMIRFSQAYKMKELFPTTSWLEIAFQFGYYDQMHLIKEFHHFTGFNPSHINSEEIDKSVKFNSVPT